MSGALTVRGLHAARGSKPVLRGVDLDVAPGEIVALMGVSGAGKSTVLRVVAALEPFTAGTVEVGGFALHPGPLPRESRLRGLRSKVGMVFQAHALFPHLTALENVAFGLRDLARGEREKRAAELLGLLELEGLAERRPAQLSGGQQQRVALARALAAEPRVLICDEVTSALDQIVAEGILRLLDRLQRELDLAIMFITHDLATVRAIADSVVVMKDGRVVDEGTKTDVFTPPHHPYTELLLSSVPEMDPGWLDRVLAARVARRA